MTSTVLHLLAMAVWLGGLASLLTLFYRASVPSRVVGRFSQLAGLSVTVLVVTGVYQSWRGLGSVAALTDTTYGRVLLAKLVAVTLLLLAGARSRRTVTRERTARNVTVEVTSVGTERETRVPEPVGGRTEGAADSLADGRVAARSTPRRAARRSPGRPGHRPVRPSPRRRTPNAGRCAAPCWPRSSSPSSSSSSRPS